MPEYRQVETDVLIIGSEAAGARAAMAAHDEGCSVVLATKSVMGKSGTTLKAVFSVAAAFGKPDPRDTPDAWMKDTVVGGRYLNNQKLVEVFCQEGATRLLELAEWGVPWDKNADGSMRIVKMYGHTYPRSVSVGFRVGLAWSKAFKRELAKRPNVKIMHDIFIADYLREKDGRVIGATAIDVKTGEIFIIKAKTTIDATGGALQVYERNSGAIEATGDGMALSYRLGNDLMDMEFVQFFPLGLIKPKALWGDEGVTSLARTWLRSKLYNFMGERFMRRYDPERMELADRDVLSLAVFKEIKEGRGTPDGGVWLDSSFLADKIIETVMNQMAPNWVFRNVNLLEVGLDLRKDPMEVAPVVHFFCGGTAVKDTDWYSGTPGLYIVGEAAAGIHGANRMPGQAFTDTQVSAKRGGEAAARYAKNVDWGSVDTSQADVVNNRVETLLKRDSGIRPVFLRKKMQKLMDAKVGVLRNGKEMEDALAELRRMQAEDLPNLYSQMKGKVFNREIIEAFEIDNMLTVSEAITLSALTRTESRGNHARDDYPQRSKDWHQNIYISNDSGKMKARTAPVVVTKIPLEG